ncbi:MAG: divalent-cation tolerance protein CutA [bacterium]|nr:MAG: divalent-cation tolerance protein CutA [bacterium]
MKYEHIIVFCTVPDTDTAHKLSKVLVEEKVAACCNIIPAVKSFYFWEENLQEDQELLLVIKTRQEVFPALEIKIRENHPYSVPEILALPIIHGNHEYLKWMDDHVRSRK